MLPSVGSKGDSYDNAMAESLNAFSRPSSSTAGSLAKRGALHLDLLVP